MDSDDLKPLIFIQPLSETLQKLKDVISETASEDGIEIFECSDLNEANQLIPTIGQSICIMSNPKMCAMMLKANRRAVKVSQSKVILLSNKQIPRNTLDKFMKIGLTECVVEPVAPKTLLYKVKLFLRSIASKNEKGKMNSLMDKETARKKALEEVKAATRKEKGQKEENEEQVLTQKKKAEEVTMENYSNVNKKSEAEDDLGGYYKGKSKNKLNMLEEEEKEQDPKESGYSEEAIDTHYKGKNSKKLELMDIDEPAHKKEEILEEEELAEMRKGLALDIEDDFKENKQKKVEELEEEFLEMQKKIKLELEEVPEEQKKSQGDEQEDLGGHMKGKINKGLDLIDIDEKDYIDKEEIEEEEIEAKKKVQLEIEEIGEEKEDYIDHQEEEDIYAKKPGVKLDIEEVIEEDRTSDLIQEEEEIQKDPKIKLEIEEDSSEDKRKKQKADEIDKYMRSAKAKKGLQLEDEAEDAIKDESQEEIEESDTDKKIKLEVEEDTAGNGKDFQDSQEEEAEEFSRKKNIKLEMMEDFDSKDKTQEEQIEDEGDSYGQKKAKLHLEDDGDLRREKGASLDEKEMNRRDSSSWQEEEKGGMGNRANARAEKIKTHYSSKESIKHNDQDWDNMWEKKEKEEEAQAKKKQDGGELIIEKEDLGEQTIDYKKLKEEFESMDYGAVRKKKKYGVSSEPALKIVDITKTLYHEDGSEEEIIFQEVVEDGEATTVNVYEPEPNGLDTAVEILNLYMISKTQIEDITTFIAKRVHERFKGKTSFFFFDKAKGSYIEEYCGHIELEVGPAPTSMSPSERDNYSRSEIKEIEKEIELELKSYNEEKETFQKDWDFLKEGKIADWQNAKLPIWSDNTFQTESNEFTYPIYEGVDPLGFAIVSFEQVFNEEDAKTLEIILESARGIYLEKVHQLRGENQNYGEEKKKVEKKKKGLLGGLFGKKAG